MAVSWGSSESWRSNDLLRLQKAFWKMKIVTASFLPKTVHDGFSLQKAFPQNVSEG